MPSTLVAFMRTSASISEAHSAAALSVVKKDAALMIKESELESFEEVLLGIVENPKRQKELGQNIKKLALPDATRRIADEVEKIVK